jgi:hypothetical protein
VFSVCTINRRLLLKIGRVIGNRAVYGFRALLC